MVIRLYALFVFVLGLYCLSLGITGLLQGVGFCMLAGKLASK